MENPETPRQPDSADPSVELTRKKAQLAALNEANLLVSGERMVSSVLQRVVDISQDFSGARYAALGVLDDPGRL